MKVEATPMNPINGNTPAARKPSDNPVIQDQNQSKEYVPVGTENVSPEKLDKAIQVANDAFKEMNVGFRYTLDKNINRQIVQVVNTQTGEIIRQLPPKEIINMLTRMYDMLGILVDKKI